MLFAAAQAERVQKLLEARVIHLPSIHQDGQRDVLHHVQDRDKVIELIDEADLAAAEDRQRRVGAGVDVLPIHINVAARRAVYTAENMQQRRFAGAGRADDGKKLPARDGKAHVIQRMDSVLPRAVGFGQMFDRQKIHRYFLPFV